MMASATHNFVKIVSDKSRVTYTALRPCFHIGGGVAAGPLVGEAPEDSLAMPIRFLALIVSLLALAAPAFAADTNHDIKGLYLLTDYPAVTVQPGTTSTVSLKLRSGGAHQRGGRESQRRGQSRHHRRAEAHARRPRRAFERPRHCRQG